VPPEDLEEEVRLLAQAICHLPMDAIVMGRMCRRRMVYEQMGLTVVMPLVTYYTMDTNISYKSEERGTVFIRDRENMGAREDFHKLHIDFERPSTGLSTSGA